MQIFVLDHSAENCAKMLNLKHLCKQIAEHCQLMCNIFPEDMLGVPYKRTHYNHPCSLWVRSAGGNLSWLYDYTLRLLDRYTNVYGKQHKCRLVANWINRNYTPGTVGREYMNRSLESFIFVGPEKFKILYHINNNVTVRLNSAIINAYRQYYIEEKSSFSKWETRGVIPSWFTPARAFPNEFIRRT